MSDQTITNGYTSGAIIVSVVGAVALAGFSGSSNATRDYRNISILLSVVFLAMIVIVFSGFMDTSLQFAGIPDIRNEVAKAIRTAVGVGCGIVFIFFLISLLMLRKDPSLTQQFTSTMMYLSFLLSFISISVLSLQNSP
jgi:predicted membrane channel-forming protein YqfA (hemolysin III family)